MATKKERVQISVFIGNGEIFYEDIVPPKPVEEMTDAEWEASVKRFHDFEQWLNTDVANEAQKKFGMRMYFKL